MDSDGLYAGIWLRFVLGVLATWRVSHLIVSEDGPWNVIARLRRRLGATQAGQWMDCFGCTSLWVAAPFAPFVVRGTMEVAICWLALSGAALLLQQWRPSPIAIEPLIDTDEESSHGMLR